MTNNGTEPILTAAAMRSADAYTIEEFGIPGFTLMESAGRGAAEALGRRIAPNARVVVHCGKGNNGGDGFVMARYLHGAGAAVRVVYLGDPDVMRGDAGEQFRVLRRLAGEQGVERLTLEAFDEKAPLPAADVYVDALLGTGSTRALREPIHTLVARLNDATGLKVAIDIPTGLHTDLGRPLGAAFRADLTFTMGAMKTGLLLHDGPRYSGQTEVVNIGIPSFALRRSAERSEPGCAFLPSDALIESWRPERSSDAHKYSVGMALLIAGSPGMTGAPFMAAAAAARAGAGYVVCGCDERIQETLAGKLTEATTVSLPSGEDGIDPDGARDALETRLDKARALLVGCGLGRADRTQEFVRHLLEETDLPTVVDADGLNALAGHMDLVRGRANGRWILTPHLGEFRRLAGEGLGGIDPDDSVALAQHFARAWNCVLVLKGIPSVTAAPDGRAWINATGGPGLATAGTGDVLAGMCVGLLAQGLTPVQAAVSALHLGGAAADRYARNRSAASMQAADLLSELPFVIRERLEA